MKVSVFGFRAIILASGTAYSAYAPLHCSLVAPYTWSPTSNPGTPSRMRASQFPTPAAFTRTSTCPAPVSGRGRSSVVITLGGPNRRIRTAFICPPLDAGLPPPPLRAITTSRLRTNEPDADRIADQPRDPVDAQALHQLGAVGVDRLDAQVEARGDLLGGEALRDELQHLALARGEDFERLLACSRFSALGVARHHVLRDGGAQPGVATRERAQGHLELCTVGLLEQVARSAREQSAAHEFFVCMHGDDDDARAGVLLASSRGDFDPVHSRHGDVD